MLTYNTEYERKADERNRRQTRNFIITIATLIAIIIGVLVWSSVKDGNTHWNRDKDSNAVCLSFVSDDIENSIASISNNTVRGMIQDQYDELVIIGSSRAYFDLKKTEDGPDLITPAEYCQSVHDFAATAAKASTEK